MNADVVIIGAGPAGIFTALEMVKKGSKQKIIMVEKGQAVENRHCPKDKTKKCVNCKPYCHITTGFSGAGAFSDGKLSLSYEVGGDLPTLITPELAQETIDYADQIYLDFGADEHIEGLGNDEERKEIRKHAIQAGLKLVDCPIRHMGTEKAQVYTSFFYEKNQGIALQDERQDYGGRVNASFKLFDDWLEVRPAVDYRQAARNNHYPNFQQAMRNNPTRSPYDPDSETE